MRHICLSIVLFLNPSLSLYCLLSFKIYFPLSLSHHFLENRVHSTRLFSHRKMLPQTPIPAGNCPLLIGVLLLLAVIPFGVPKSTIEPCSNSDTCSSLVGYTLYTDLKVSEVASLFQTDPIALLTANAVDISVPDVENHILPARLFLKVPLTCSCVDGIFKSAFVHYKTRPSDTLSFIADTVYSGLVSADQIKEGNPNAVGSDPSVLNVGTNLWIPLPCTCFNGSDNNLPAIYMSYVVTPVDTLAGIAATYSTTLTDLMTVNDLGSPAIKEGDILAIPLSACASSFPKYASDFALSVPNGSYAITASHCVQCSCGPGSRNLYCMPASLAVSCSSMQCKNSNMMLGNVTVQQTSGGCNVTSCDYGGFVNNTIVTVLSSSLQPRCPGPQQFPPLKAPPSSVGPDVLFSPAPAPIEAGGAPIRTPTSSVVPSTAGSAIAFPPSNGPSGSSSSACTLLSPLSRFPNAVMLGLFLKYWIFV
ncbi:PREDICTED: lysM domain-containing GPI-anchored protein 1-like [Ipomoea nil]|uniref:lysM domain-containing GPI-anchored protein 1-like n=1 Tax=Ipomoea nil TaxID=35883 RepID=UPI00090142D5|nr:PREDICTED: lysM domain-containing GPI-anchored protein 1-like [Ipomoea nil]XP_019176955.1 PREDICTED: lysM domain-containing GPI-anchored protein 1-like [Ipomoea nil]